jgi:hypothetical protein
MQVSIRITRGATLDVWNIGLVAFEFGVVKDPHELLQDEPRFRQWEYAVESADRVLRELRTSLMDAHRGLLGRRGNLWGANLQLAQLARMHRNAVMPIPWEVKQELCPTTLLWAARRIPPGTFRVPAAVGLEEGNALHEAIQQAVLLQAASRSLSLNKDFRTKSHV